MNKIVVMSLLVGLSIVASGFAEPLSKAVRPQDAVVGNNFNFIQSSINSCCTIPSFSACCNDIIVTLTDINNTLTTCCNDIVVTLTELNNTFTVCCNDIFITLTDINNTLTTCCNDIVITLTELNATFTICCNDIFVTLTELNTTITECCNSTFTVLEDITTTITTCCADLQATITADFMATWTILTDIFTSSTTCCASTFTVLEDLRNTITECCNGTFTVLANLTVTATTDLSGVFTVLTDIENTLTTCCEAMSACNRTTLTVAQVIDTPGSYCLGDDIVGVITIASNNVSLDLNGYTISDDVNGVVVSSGFQNIEIHNGRIYTTQNEAILINDGCRALNLHNLMIVDCGLNGITFAVRALGAGSRIASCLIDSLLIENCAAGIALVNTDESSIKNSIISNVAATFEPIGIQATSSGPAANALTIENCTINSVNTVIGNAIGIDINNVVNIVCQSNTIKALTSVVFVAAMRVQNTTNCAIANSIIEGVGATSTGRGIYFSQTTDYIIRDCIFADVFGGSVGGWAIYLDNSDHGIVENNQMSAISTESGEAAAIRVISSSSVIMQNCSCSRLFASGTGDAAGFIMTGESLLLQNCSVDQVIANNFAAGYLVRNAAVLNNLMCLNCQAMNILVNNTGAGQSAYGFDLTGTVNSVLCQNCDVVHVSAPNGNGNSTGFFLGNTVTHAELDSCTVITVTADNGRGFDIALASNAPFDGAVLRKCKASFIGERGINIQAVVNQALVEDCRVEQSNGGIIDGSTNAIVINCIASNNTTNYTISAPSTVSSLGSLVFVLGTNISAPV